MAQAPRICMLGVGDPRADTPLNLVEPDRPGAIAIPEPAQPVAKAAHVFVGKAAIASG